MKHRDLLGRNRRLKFITLTGIAAVVLLLVIAVRFKQNTPLCPKCNVLVIAVDSLRSDALPCTGYPLNTSPNICAFAGESALFTKAFANAPWTLPSEMSVFTGLLPSSHGVNIPVYESLNPAVKTLPELLQAYGYATSFISSKQANVAPEVGFGRGFDRISDEAANDQVTPWTHALDFIEKSNTDGKPAFVFIHTDRVHGYISRVNALPEIFPLDPSYKIPDLKPAKDSFLIATRTKNYLESILGNDLLGNESIELYKTWNDQIRQAGTTNQQIAVFDSLPQRDKDWITAGAAFDTTEFSATESIALKRHLYDWTIADFDRDLGKFLSETEHRNLLKNTVVVIYSEHGESLGEHALEGHKNSLYNHELQVPLIIRVPRLPAKIIPSIVGLTDLFPTLLSLVGAPRPVRWLSTDLSDLLSGLPFPEKNLHVISQTDEPSAQTIQTESWKYHEPATPDGYTMPLFHLSVDPGETKPVNADHPVITTTLRWTLRQTVAALPEHSPTIRPFPAWMDTEIRKRLIRTGYFN